nr:hypothetical protein [Tanacetum cinerariifolium]
MAALKSCPKHNMVAYLEKTEGNAQFHEIFWNSATSKTHNNVSQTKAKVAGQRVVITEASIRRDLLFNDVDGIDCLSTQAIFENLSLMGYERDLTKLTFQKSLFFSSEEVPDSYHHSLLKPVTHLFPSMLAQAAVEEGKGPGQSTGPQPTLSPTQPSVGDQTHETTSSSSLKNTEIHRILLEGTDGLREDQTMEHTPNNSPSSVLRLVKDKNVQAVEILNLKERVYKLEKRQSIYKYRYKLSELHLFRSGFSKMRSLVDKGVDYVVNKGRLTDKIKVLNAEAEGVSAAGETLSAATLAVSTASVQEASISAARIVSTIGPSNTDVVGPSNQENVQDLFDDETRIADILVNIENMKRTSKRQKTDADLKEEEQLRVFLNIIPDEKGKVDYADLDKRYPIVDWKSEFYHNDRYGKPHNYYRVFRADGSSSYIKNFTEMVLKFDRLDFSELQSLVMQRFETATPEEIDLILWGDLRIMFEESADDDLWKNQEEWILKS